MNMLLAAGGGLAMIVGLVHSVLGEVLIFRPLARAGLPVGVLRARHVNILWASWHIVTLFGWGIAALLIWFAIGGMGVHDRVVVYGISAVTGVAAGMVLYATKARHPGWVGLLGVAVLAALGVM